MKEQNPKMHLTSLDSLFTTQAERDNADNEQVIKISIDSIHDFPNHPFKVNDDEDMNKLIESIQERGVYLPTIVRQRVNGDYEMISGHRRKHAAIKAGLKTIPCIVKNLTDDEATILMVDSNIQREELLPSEKAFAYKMKLDAMKRQAGRPAKNNSGQFDQNLAGRVSRDILAKEVGESSKQIQRYIRLTELQPKLLDLVDSKRLNFTVAVDISYIDKEIQNWLYDYIDANGTIIPNQVKTLRKAIDSGTVMTQQKMVSILNECIKPKSTAKNVTFSGKKLEKYFPESYTAADVEKIVFELLGEWKNRKEH